MRRLQIYILWRTLMAVGAVLAVLGSVVALVQFVELSRTVGGRADASFATLLRLVLLEAPAVILLLMPFIFLFGVMGAFVALNRRNELIAMRAAGMSAWRFVGPAALCAAVIGAAVTVALNPIASQWSALYQTERAALEEAGGGRGEVWLRQTAGGEPVFIHARRQVRVGDTVRLEGVTAYVENRAAGAAMVLGRRIEAGAAVVTPGAWRLQDVREAAPGEGVVGADEVRLGTDRGGTMTTLVSPAAVGFWDLPDQIRAASTSGYATAPYALRLQQLLALPLLLGAMAILAASCSLRLMRLGDLVLMAGAGVAIGFAIFFLNQFLGALGANQALPVTLAAWVVPIITLLSGLTLLAWTEDG
ncbi:MAG: LptF/LptG family permease [Alphaproteobacteria bacterium]|nr:LptF/LptG family permease [Alphaproteobacteria bacterium]